MSKSYCVWGFCDHMLLPALVDGVLKFLFEVLKFGLLLVGTFWLAIGIFSWWDYATPPVCTNFGLQPSSVSINDPDSKKSQKPIEAACKKPEFQIFSVKSVEKDIRKEGFTICKCGRRLQKEVKGQNYFPTNKTHTAEQCQTSSRQVMPTVQQGMPAFLSEIDSTLMRTGPAQPSRATPSRGPCDGPNIAQIYSELMKKNVMQMYINEMRHVGLSEDLLDKVKRSNMSSATPVGNRIYPESNSQLATTSPLRSKAELLVPPKSDDLLDKVKQSNMSSATPVGNRIYPESNSHLATTSPLGSQAELFLPPKQASVINADLSYGAVAPNRDGSLRASSNEDIEQLLAQIQKPDKDSNPVNLTNEIPSSLHATLPQSVSNDIPAPSNNNIVPKERDSEARVCRCRNPKCKRRVQMY